MRDLVIGLLVWGAVVGALLSMSVGSPPPQVRSYVSEARRPVRLDAAQELRMIHDRAGRETLLY